MEVQVTLLFNSEAIRHPLIEHALELVSVIKGMLGEEYGVYVSDMERYLYCDHGVIKLPLQAGDLFKEASITGQCLQRNQRTVAKVGKEVYGTAYLGNAYPMIDSHSHELVGSLAMIIPSRQEELISIANQTEKPIEFSADLMVMPHAALTQGNLAVLFSNFLHRRLLSEKD